MLIITVESIARTAWEAATGDPRRWGFRGRLDRFDDFSELIGSQKPFVILLDWYLSSGVRLAETLPLGYGASVVRTR